MPSQKKFLEFDLPPQILQLISKELGPTKMNRLSPQQRADLTRLTNGFAAELVRITQSSKQRPGAVPRAAEYEDESPWLTE